MYPSKQLKLNDDIKVEIYYTNTIPTKIINSGQKLGIAEVNQVHHILGGKKGGGGCHFKIIFIVYVTHLNIVSSRIIGILDNGYIFLLVVNYLTATMRQTQTLIKVNLF